MSYRSNHHYHNNKIRFVSFQNDQRTLKFDLNSLRIRGVCWHFAVDTRRQFLNRFSHTRLWHTIRSHASFAHWFCGGPTNMGNKGLGTWKCPTCILMHTNSVKWLSVRLCAVNPSCCRIDKTHVSARAPAIYAWLFDSVRATFHNAIFSIRKFAGRRVPSCLKYLLTKSFLSHGNWMRIRTITAATMRQRWEWLSSPSQPPPPERRNGQKLWGIGVVCVCVRSAYVSGEFNGSAIKPSYIMFIYLVLLGWCLMMIL